MKNLIFAVVFTFCLFSISYAQQNTTWKNALLVTENDFQAVENHFFQVTENGFWVEENSLWMSNSLGESCSVSNGYGSCSVTCEGKKKAHCIAGYIKWVGQYRREIIPPKCYCSGAS